MKIRFEPLGSSHGTDVIRIYNEYITTSTFAFAESALSGDFYQTILNATNGYPSYALVDEEGNRVIGFCFLKPFHPLSTFKATATITYFIERGLTKSGLGSLCLAKLEEEARQKGIEYLIAEISSENEASINFHKKQGFEVAGELKGIGRKLNRSFSVFYLQKQL